VKTGLNHSISDLSIDCEAIVSTQPNIRQLNATIIFKVLFILFKRGLTFKGYGIKEKLLNAVLNAT
jgi:hypothetical protein